MRLDFKFAPEKSFKVFLMKKYFFYIVGAFLAISIFCFVNQDETGFVLPNKVDATEILVKLRNQEKIYTIQARDFSVESVLTVLKQNSAVELAEPNYRFKISADISAPNDTFYSRLWYLSRIQAEEAWSLNGGGKREIIVAVLDTGVQIEHPDLKDNIWTNAGEIKGNGIDDDHNNYIDDVNGWDFLNDNPDPNPKFTGDFNESGVQHGTLISGIIGAVGRNGQGVIGTSYGARIMPLRVLNNEGMGSVDDVIRGINYAIYNGAKIINLSFVGTEKSIFLKEALKKAWGMGVIVVAAAGNETADGPLNLSKTPTYPICLDSGDNENFIIGVAATDIDDKKATFSDYGSTCIDVSAPGLRFFGTTVVKQGDPNFSDYYSGYWSGTSLAAPLVSAEAALIWSANPLLTQKQVRDIIMEQADNIDMINQNYAGHLGRGRINVFRAVNYTLNQTNLNSNYYIATAPQKGGGPHVRIFDLQGNAKGGFFAYDKKFTGGVSIASGDVDGDGIDEIITGPAQNKGPEVKVFDYRGGLKLDFYAFNEKYRAGISLFSGSDIDGDYRDDIITGINGSASPYVRIFEGQSAILRLQFLSYERLFYGGVKVAASRSEELRNQIIVGLGPGREPYVFIFDDKGVLLNKFLAYVPAFKGGINVSTIKIKQ